MKTIDIIIPTYKPDRQFFLLLDRLAQQTCPVRRILVINTEKSYWDALVGDMPFEQKYPFVEVRHISAREFDHAATRQMAAKLSDAAYFVMMTQDAMPADTLLLEKLTAPLAREQVAVSYARQLPARDAGLIEVFTRQFNYPQESMEKSKKDCDRLGIKTYFCSDVCAAYRRDIFEKLGGFEAPAIFNEDMIYAAKAVEGGYSIYYAADARVVHSHNYSGLQQLRRNFDLGVSQAQHPEIFEKVSSESTGIAMVKKTAAWLCRKGKPYLVCRLVWVSGCKYLGYLLGKHYERLPRAVIMKCTASPGYWEKL